MRNLLLLTVLYTASIAVVVSVGEYNVTITTDPSQGPFRLGQRVQFSCLVEPTPPGPVTYQWRNVESVESGSSRNQQSFSRTYSIYDYLPHSCYYSCEVSVNKTLVGFASRVVQVQGFLYTEAVVRSFSHGGNLELNMNISENYYARHISSLTWYHNGTEITSGNKYSISNDATMLRITNMVASDAGSYVVKIGSISYYGILSSSSVCDSKVLPLLELLSVHAPVTFTVQERCVPTYNPSSTISILYVSESRSGHLELTGAVQFNSSLSITSTSHRWYRNGIQISDGGMYNSTGSNQGLSLQIMYNNTDDVTGDYVGILWTYRNDIDDLSSMCEAYYYYLTDPIDFQLYLIFHIIPLATVFWSIRLDRLPSSVILHYGAPILTGLETTTVECSAVGGGPVESFNLTLWRNEELLGHINARHLSHMTMPYQYGTYMCLVDSLHDTSVLMERAPFQLLFGEIGPASPLCNQSPSVDVMKTAVVDLLRLLCQSCDAVSPTDIVDMQLNCSASGTIAYLTADLVYSSPDGRVTASTLINRLLVWLLSEDNPSIFVDGNPVALSKQCPTQLNEVTRNGCIKLLASETTETMFTTDALVAFAAPSSTGYIVVGFFAGVVTGILIIVVIIVLIICVVKLRAHTAQPSESQETGKSADIPMDTNQAYETVDTHNQAYETVDMADELGRMQEEVIYDLVAK